MRLVILVSDLVHGPAMRAVELWNSRRLLRNNAWLRRRFVHPTLHTDTVWGGTLNNMRHCDIARRAGFEAVLATPSGNDTYGDNWKILDLDYIKWSDRRPDDVCLVPDIATDLINDVKGRAIAYIQVPTQIRPDFDWNSERIEIWTDSPFMLEHCQAVYPGKAIPIVPNIVDNSVFPFIPQKEREPGLVFAFPRKGPEFIAATRRAYREKGGRYFRFELIDGIPLMELAQEFRRPQVFLASADIEGCALPPQESMASGIVVVGKNARGANFAMEHEQTAMIADSPERAAECLRKLEDDALRETISQNAYKQISRYFPDNEPLAFWKDNLARFSA